MVDHKKFAHHRTALLWIEPQKIVVRPGLNLRDLSTPDNAAHVEALARSIAANGFLDSEPLELAEIEGEVCVTAGHCRLAAVMLCIERGMRKIEYVPYIPEAKGTTVEDRLVNQWISNTGKTPTPMELGYNCKRLIGCGLSVKAIAERFGVSDTYVDQLLTLQAAPSDIKAMVNLGEISAGTAIKVLVDEGPTEASVTLREAVVVAKGQGKKKATMKHVNARADAREKAAAVAIVWMPKSQLLAVRIGKIKFPFAAEKWLEIGELIVASAREFVEHEEPMPGREEATSS